jgi:hypothetical protein
MRIHAYLTRKLLVDRDSARHLSAQLLQTRSALGVFQQGAQVGFGRVIDRSRATFAYLADVYVDWKSISADRGWRKRMVKALHRSSRFCKALRRWMLGRQATRMASMPDWSGRRSP